MKLKTLIAPALLCIAIGGCSLGMQDSDKARLEALTKENAELAGKVAETYAKIQNGSLTINDGKAIALELQAQLAKNIQEVVDLKAKSQMTTMGAIAAGAGILGRSALHLVVSGGIPLGPLAPFQPLLALLLGGSASKRKEEKPTV